MKNIKKVLVPTDFSSNALNAFRYAIWFADQYDATIHLLHVVYPTAEPLDFPAIATQIAQQQMEIAKELMTTFTESGLVQVHSTYELIHPPKITSEVTMGTPQVQIKRCAEEENMDIIIMGTKGEHNRIRDTFGSVTSDTLQHVPCPMLVVPEGAVGLKLKTIAYATDLQPSDPFHIWEIGKLLTPFTTIMRIVHMEQQPDEKRPISMNDLEEFFSDRPPALQITFHNIATKDVGDELSSFEDTWDVDLLVMTKPNRNFFQKLFHRSITKQLALHSVVPLLVLKA